MGLLSRLSEWIARLTGGTESEGTEKTSSDAAKAAVSDDGDDTDDGSEHEPDSTGLDPSAVAETRTTANDDAVDALRDVRRSQAMRSDADASDDPSADEESDDNDARGDRGRS